MKKIEGESRYLVNELYRRLGKRKYSSPESWTVAARAALEEAGVKYEKIGNGHYYRLEDVEKTMSRKWAATPGKKAAAMAKAREARKNRRKGRAAGPKQSGSKQAIEQALSDVQHKALIAMLADVQAKVSELHAALAQQQGAAPAVSVTPLNGA